MFNGVYPILQKKKEGVKLHSSTSIHDSIKTRDQLIFEHCCPQTFWSQNHLRLLKVIENSPDILYELYLLIFDIN